MNRRDFVLTALGASGTVAAGGAVLLDIGPSSVDDGQAANETMTATATEAEPRSPTATGTATASDTEAPPGTPTDSRQGTGTATETPGTTRTGTPSSTRTGTPGGTGTGTPSSTETGTGTPGGGSTSTPSPRDGIEVESTAQSGDDTRVRVSLTNTNDYAVYVEATVTWQFGDGSSDSETRAGVIAPSGSDTRQYSTDQQGTVMGWDVTLPTVRRI